MEEDHQEVGRRKGASRKRSRAKFLLWALFIVLK